jgi:hypothetical protein
MESTIAMLKGISNYRYQQFLFKLIKGYRRFEDRIKKRSYLEAKEKEEIFSYLVKIDQKIDYFERLLKNAQNKASAIQKHQKKKKKAVQEGPGKLNDEFHKEPLVKETSISKDDENIDNLLDNVSIEGILRKEISNQFKDHPEIIKENVKKPREKKKSLSFTYQVVSPYLDESSIKYALELHNKKISKAKPSSKKTLNNQSKNKKKKPKPNTKKGTIKVKTNNQLSNSEKRAVKDMLEKVELQYYDLKARHGNKSELIKLKEKINQLKNKLKGL